MTFNNWRLFSQVFFSSSLFSLKHFVCCVRSCRKLNRDSKPIWTRRSDAITFSGSLWLWDFILTLQVFAIPEVRTQSSDLTAGRSPRRSDTPCDPADVCEKCSLVFKVSACLPCCGCLVVVVVGPLISKARFKGSNDTWIAFHKIYVYMYEALRKRKACQISDKSYTQRFVRCSASVVVFFTFLSTGPS